MSAPDHRWAAEANKRSGPKHAAKAWAYRLTQTSPLQYAAACVKCGFNVAGLATMEEAQDAAQNHWRDDWKAQAPNPILYTSKGDEVEVKMTDEEAQKILGQQSSTFAQDLALSFGRYGSWTAGQRPWAHKLANEAVERAQRPPEPTPEGPGPYQAILALFRAASANLKYPALRLDVDGERLVLKQAGDRSKAPGTITLTDGGPYPDNRFYGRITLEGHLTGRTPDWVKDALDSLAQDPEAFLATTGIRTGTCCCCGRELTNAESVRLGIGPICRANWGL